MMISHDLTGHVNLLALDLPVEQRLKQSFTKVSLISHQSKWSNLNKFKALYSIVPFGQIAVYIDWERAENIQGRVQISFHSVGCIWQLSTRGDPWQDCMTRGTLRHEWSDKLTNLNHNNNVLYEKTRSNFKAKLNKKRVLNNSFGKTTVVNRAMN